MKGEKLNLLLGLLLLPSLLMAQKSPLEPWQDPEVNEVNRMAAHTDFVNKNEWRMSLHGVWGEMPIPGMWEMNGLGEPMYCGIGYEWKTWWKSNPPALPDSANYSYTYVRNWTVPKAWKGRDVILQLRSFNLIHWTRTNLDLTALTCPTGEVDAEGNPLPWSEMGCAWAPEMITTEDGRIMMHFTPLGYFDDGQSPMRRTNFSEQKHGAVVQVTKKELNKLIKYWNK